MHVLIYVFLSISLSEPVLQWFGHPRVLGISIPKTLGIGMGITFSYYLSELDPG